MSANPGAVGPTKTTNPTTEAVIPAKPQQAKVEDAPDPDEDVPDPDEDFPDDDDLDDLDDELDQFISQPPKAPPVPQKPTEPASSSASKGKEQDEGLFPGDDDDFSKQFGSELRELMSQIDNSPEMQAEMEKMFANIEQVAEAELKGGASGPAAPPGSSRPGTSHSTTGPKPSFKDTIAGLQDQLRNSDQATRENLASGTGQEELLMEQLLKGLNLGEGGVGTGSEDDFSGLLLGLMEQLTGKEILYEPMKELETSFPAWMEKNKDKTPEAEMKNFREQLRLVREIVGKFEEPGYSDDDPERRKYIVDRMQAMQATGSVPAELLGDSQSLQEAFSGDQGCNPQ